MKAWLQHKRKAIDVIEIPDQFPRTLQIPFKRTIKNHLLVGYREYTFVEKSRMGNVQTGKSESCIVYKLTNIKRK